MVGYLLLPQIIGFLIMGHQIFRNKILKTSKIEEYIDFGEYFVFDSADGSYNDIYIK